MKLDDIGESLQSRNVKGKKLNKVNPKINFNFSIECFRHMIVYCIVFLPK